MTINQFANISKDLYTQIKVIESMVKSDLFKEAHKMLSTAEKNFGKLESAIAADNPVQTHIVNNRRLEIQWLQDSVKRGLLKRPVKPVKKRNSKQKP